MGAHNTPFVQLAFITDHRVSGEQFGRIGKALGISKRALINNLRNYDYCHTKTVGFRTMRRWNREGDYQLHRTGIAVLPTTLVRQRPGGLAEIVPRYADAFHAIVETSARREHYHASNRNLRACEVLMYALTKGVHRLQGYPVHYESRLWVECLPSHLVAYYHLETKKAP